MGLFGNSNAPRRELKRNDLAKRGVVAVAVAVLVLGLTYLRTTGAFSDDPEVKATLRNVGGSLTTGSDVKMKGALIGKVSSIEEAKGKVEVTLTLKDDSIRKVPANVTARVLPATVFGTAFVDLTAPQPSSEMLSNGKTIAEDVSKPTIELQQALDDIDSLVKALGPAELASAIGSAAQALNGRGDQLGRIFERTNSLLNKVNPQWPLFSENIRLLAENLEIVSTHAPALLDAVDDTLVAAATLVEKQAQFTTLLTGGRSLLLKSDKFLLANKNRFLESIRLASIVTDAVYDNRQAGLRGSFLANMNLTRRAQPSFTGGWIWTTAYVTTVSPAYYSSCPGYQGRACR